MLGPYPTEAVIAKLGSVTALRIVGGVADFETAKTEPPRSAPAAYVLREETAQPGDYAEHGRQRVTVIVKVVVWVRHAGSADTGAKAEAAMTAVEADVRGALMGFKPAGSRYEPLALRASGNDQYYGNHLVRQVLFQADYIASEGTP